MSSRRLILAATLVLAAASSGCTMFNDRFVVPGQDPLLTFLGYQPETASREWLPAELPDLAPRRTELIPYRRPPPGPPAIGWPPL